MNWTIDKVKSELPDVTVAYFGGVTEKATLLGRLEKFPVLVVGERHARYEVSWRTVVRSLNENKPIFI